METRAAGFEDRLREEVAKAREEARKESNAKAPASPVVADTVQAAASVDDEQEQACDDASADDDDDNANANFQDEKAVSSGDSSPVKLDGDGEEELSDD